jgi:FHS family glucose/mannose:H+ symporter-like MFS transporter
VVAAPTSQDDRPLPGTRRALAGFFVSGLLLSFTGSILPAWGYHLRSDYLTIAGYFLSLATGILISLRLAQVLLRAKGIAFVLSCGCAVGCGAILFLAFVGPPVEAWWRMFGLACIGGAAGLLQSAIFQAISPIYVLDRAAAVNLAGALLGGGCLAMALLVAGTFYVYTVPSILVLVAAIPGLFAGAYARTRYPARPLPQHLSIRDGLRQAHSPVTALLALLLLFQFGNEWAMAGWLPLFLVQRLGISPERSLQLLAVYWLALIVGRVVSQSALPRISHARLLFVSAVLAVFGSIVLAVTENRSGGLAGVILIGAAWAPIYPLVVESIGNRFSNYHPGLFNGIFSLAFAGALLAPSSLGVLASIWGIRAVMVLPAAGTIIVLALVMAMWLQARLSAGHGKSRSASP